MENKRLPRKLKKTLKKVLLKGINHIWKTSELKIIEIGRKKHSGEKSYKEIAVKSYRLG